MHGLVFSRIITHVLCSYKRTGSRVRTEHRHGLGGTARRSTDRPRPQPPRARRAARAGPGIPAAPRARAAPARPCPPLRPRHRAPAARLGATGGLAEPGSSGSSAVALGSVRACVCSHTKPSPARASPTRSLLGELCPKWGGKLGRSLHPAPGVFRHGPGERPPAPGTPEIGIYSAASRDDPAVGAPPRRPDPRTPPAGLPLLPAEGPAPRRSVTDSRRQEERRAAPSLAERCNLKLATTSLGLSVSWKPGLWAARFSMSSAGSAPPQGGSGEATPSVRSPGRLRGRRRLSCPHSPGVPSPCSATRSHPLPQLFQHQKPPSIRTHSHTPM